MVSPQITINQKTQNQMLKKLSSLLLVGFSLTGLSQTKTDTVIVSEHDFLQQALNYAPLAENNRLGIDFQDEKINEARGAFEPKLQSDLVHKRFDDKRYYTKSNSSVKANLPIGGQLSGGFDRNAGLFINPENNLPMQGLAYVGVEIPLGAGMFTDANRTKLRQERERMTGAELETQLANNLYLLEAGNAYWEWYGSILLLELAQEAVNKAQVRYNFVKRRYIANESAGIDTLEAFINYQNRIAFYQNALIKYTKNEAILQTYLWLPNHESMKLQPNVNRDFTATLPASNSLDSLIATHPYLRLLQNDSLVNELDQRLAREYYKPELNFEFKMQENAAEIAPLDYNIRENNYVGVNFAFPVLLRKQRAKAAQYSIKQDMIANKYTNLKQLLESKLFASFNNVYQLQENARLMFDVANNYEVLLNAEQVKFRLGESTLFIINNRELRWISSREKYIKEYVSFRKEILNFYYNTGLLPQSIN
jgi:outer membrane protein